MKTLEPKIIVYPAFNPYYYAYYLKGLIDLFGHKKIIFSNKSFPKLNPSFFAFISIPQKIKFFIDAMDSSHFDEEGLRWSDYYHKVNIDINYIPQKYQNKIFSTPPSFGIRIWDLDSTFLNLMKNLQYAFAFKENLKYLFTSYLRQYYWRLPLSYYQQGISRSNYLFFSSSVWAPEDFCNKYRLNFIKAANSFKDIEFEGGFAPPHRDDIPELDAFFIPKRYPLTHYLKNTQSSLLCFNTPAVLDCHGWKLPEFLALGKAIISTQFKRKLTKPLIHGKHIHYIDGSIESIKDAISIFRENKSYRISLEINAMNYFKENLMPKIILKQIIENHEK